MGKIKSGIRLVMVLPAVLFILIGLSWILDPAGVAPDFGFPLLSGLGLSSQVGDLAAFFLTAGLCALAGIVTKTRHWFYAPVMLLSLTALGRILAWMIHHAEFAGQMIMTEILVALLWYFGSKITSEKSA